MSNSDNPINGAIFQQQVLEVASGTSWGRICLGNENPNWKSCERP